MRPTTRLKTDSLRAYNASHFLQPSPPSILTSFCQRSRTSPTACKTLVSLGNAGHARKQLTTSTCQRQTRSQAPTFTLPTRPLTSIKSPPSISNPSSRSTSSTTSNPAPAAPPQSQDEASSNPPSAEPDSSTPDLRREIRINSLLDSYAARRKAAADETSSALASMTLSSSGPPIASYSDRESTALAPLRLKPSLGRTIAINRSKGVDVNRALGLLGMRLARNRVRGDMNAQRFHERPGLKRKRFRTSRREKRFLQTYLEMKQKVLYMVRKGY